MDCDTLFKIILIGNSGTGKSSLRHRYVHDRFSEDQLRTIGVEFSQKETTIIVNRKNGDEAAEKKGPQSPANRTEKADSHTSDHSAQRNTEEEEKKPKQQNHLQLRSEEEDMVYSQNDSSEYNEGDHCDKCISDIDSGDIGDSSSTVVENEGQVVVRVKAQIWDTAGQDRFRTIANCYYRGSHGCFLCYDISNRESFLALDKWLEELTDKNYATDCINVLVGTKSDLVHIRAVSIQEGKQFAQERGMYFMETSARSGTNVDEAFDCMIKQLFEKYKKRILSPRGNGMAYVPPSTISYPDVTLNNDDMAPPKEQKPKKRGFWSRRC